MKHPGSVLGDDWQHKTSRDPKVIASWFAGTDHGVFLHCGRSGAIVFDVDDPDNLHADIGRAVTALAPPAQSTRLDRPGQCHYVFAVPPGRSFGNGIGELSGGWGEVRSKNGVIIVAPSVHEKHSDGARYRWLSCGRVPELPPYLAERLPDALSAADAVPDAELEAFLATHSAEVRPELLGVHVAHYQRQVAAGESRHQSMMGHLAGAMKEAAAGLIDARLAADTLEGHFLAAVAAPARGKQNGIRTGSVAVSEWRGMLAWAIGQTRTTTPEKTAARVAEKVPHQLTGLIPPDRLNGLVIEEREPPSPTVAEVDDEFFDSRPIFKHLQQAAYSSMTSPWAVLGVTIIRMLATVPPWVTLPPVIGRKGSLNLFCALVGPSGVGKGASEAVAREAVTFPNSIHVVAIGSGEGIAHQYGHFDGKKEVVYDRHSVVFTVSEIDTLTALGNRQGSTLLGQLRAAFSGEQLGFAYADRTRRIPLDPHKYRLGLIAGVQPEKAGPLLNDADGGTPQRFIWMPATDPKISADAPEWPPPMRVDHEWNRGAVMLSVPPTVEREIRENHALRARGEGAALDGHATYARLKVAQALTLLDGRTAMELDDWYLSGLVMKTSDHTRGGIEMTLQRIHDRQTDAVAASEARRRLLIDATLADEGLKTVSRVAQVILRKMAESGGSLSGSDARRSLASRDRKHYDAAVAYLEDEQSVRILDVSGGVHLEILTKVDTEVDMSTPSPTN